MKNLINLPYCFDLQTKPNVGMGKILVTGASGYIGGRLVPELIDRGYDVRILVRGETSEDMRRWPNAEVFVGDALMPGSLDHALEGITVAYYLIHSLLLGRNEFQYADIKAAENFRISAEKKGVKRIIYLGGLGDVKSKLSNHLKSRIQVAKILSEGKIPVTILRAAVIIGSGSASYEIIRNLVKNTPILFIPKWARTKCQPLSIRDVIKYLVGVLEEESTTGKSFDIGGQDLLSYKEMLKIQAALLNKKRIYINIPSYNYSVFGYIASLLTPVPAPVVMSLMEGGSNEVVCKNNQIKDIININPLSYSEAVILALDREEQDNIRTRWTDAYPPAHELAVKLHEIYPTRYISTYSIHTKKKNALLFCALCKIGGKEGWFYNNWMWRLRGMVDKLLMGVGHSRGRRSSSTLRINDVIDFWRIEDLKINKRLLLRAEMKLPGKAWLEFNIEEKEIYNVLSITAFFQNKGFLGKIYWYIFLPFHYFIFTKLIKGIEKEC